LSQLRASVTQATSDLLKLVTKKKNDAARKIKDEASKKTESDKQKASEAADMEKKRISKAKRSDFMKVQYSSCGFSEDSLAVATFPGDGAWAAATTKDDHMVFCQPAIIKESVLVSHWAEDASNILRATLDRWCTQFATSSIAKKNDVVHAPLTDQHGQNELTHVFDAVCKVRLPSANASLSRSLDRWELYGETVFFCRETSTSSVWHPFAFRTHASRTWS
jgi:hypothetical protein